MNRFDRARNGFLKNMKLIEIGPSHRPIIAKRDGWNTVVVDYANADHLREAYKKNDIDAIEDVDVVWEGGLLHTKFREEQLNSFDGIVSSHSFEHLPNPIAFLQSCEKLLKTDGRIIFALPDKRCCFDFFGNPSTTGDMLSAHHDTSSVHSPKTAFNHTAYSILSKGRGSWTLSERLENIEIMFPLDLAYGVFRRAIAHKDGPYYDFHAWRFTPSSFSLIILELAYLGLINFRVDNVTTTVSQEFFVDLVKGKEDFKTKEELQRDRLELMKAVLDDIYYQKKMMLE